MRKVEQSTEKQTAVGADSQVEQTTEKVGKNQRKKQKKRKKMEELELTKDQVQAKNDELQLAIDKLEAELAARDRADSDDNAVMNDKLVATTESLDVATKNLDEKNITIGMLQRDIAASNDKLMATTELLDVATKNLSASESACDEKNITIGMLQRDIAATNDKLVATTESLNELESSKALVVTQLAKRNVELERLLEQTTQSNQDKIDKLESSKDQVVDELVMSREKIDELVLSMEQVMAKNEELQLAFDQADLKTVMIESSKDQVEDKFLELERIAQLEAQLVVSQNKIVLHERSIQLMDELAINHITRVEELEAKIVSLNHMIDELELSKEQVNAQLVVSQNKIVLHERSIQLGDELAINHITRVEELEAKIASLNHMMDELELSKEQVDAYIMELEAKLDAYHSSEEVREETEAKIVELQRSLEHTKQSSRAIIDELESSKVDIKAQLAARTVEMAELEAKTASLIITCTHLFPHNVQSNINAETNLALIRDIDEGTTDRYKGWKGRMVPSNGFEECRYKQMHNSRIKIGRNVDETQLQSLIRELCDMSNMHPHREARSEEVSTKIYLLVRKIEELAIINRVRLCWDPFKDWVTAVLNDHHLPSLRGSNNNGKRGFLDTNILPEPGGIISDAKVLEVFSWMRAYCEERGWTFMIGDNVEIIDATTLALMYEKLPHINPECRLLITTEYESMQLCTIDETIHMTFDGTDAKNKKESSLTISEYLMPELLVNGKLVPTFKQIKVMRHQFAFHCTTTYLGTEREQAA